MNKLILFCAIVVATGCKMDRNAEIFRLPSDIEVVVHSSIQPDSIPLVSLTFTSGIDELNERDQNLLDRLRESSVSIQDELGNEWNLEYVNRSEIQPYYFQAVGNFDRNVIFKTQHPNVLKNGTEYFLSVSTPEMGQFSATTTIPDSVMAVAKELKMDSDILDCEVDDCGIRDTGRLFVNRLTFEIESPNDDQFYVLASYTVIQVTESGLLGPGEAINHFAINLPLQKSFLFTDPNGERLAQEPFSYRGFVGFTNEVFKGTTFDLVIHFTASASAFVYNPNPIIDYFALYSVNKEYFEYIRMTSLQESTYYLPFSEPVFIPTNIENGQGFFGGMRLLAIQPVSFKGQEFLAQ